MATSTTWDGGRTVSWRRRGQRPLAAAPHRAGAGAGAGSARRGAGGAGTWSSSSHLGSAQARWGSAGYVARARLALAAAWLRCSSARARRPPPGVGTARSGECPAPGSGQPRQLPELPPEAEGNAAGQPLGWGMPAVAPPPPWSPLLGILHLLALEGPVFRGVFFKPSNKGQLSGDQHSWQQVGGAGVVEGPGIGEKMTGNETKVNSFKDLGILMGEILYPCTWI